MSVPRRELRHAGTKPDDLSMILFRKPVPTFRDHAPPNLRRERSFAFSASTSRSRAGACVCSEVNSRRAASETSATAWLNAASLACEGLLKPESLRTNCSAEAWISSSVAGGSKLNSVLMLRHMKGSLAARPKDERRMQDPTYRHPLFHPNSVAGDNIFAWLGFGLARRE